LYTAWNSHKTGENRHYAFFKFEARWSWPWGYDRDVKKPNENLSIGVLLCKDKDSEVVEYALSRSLSPTMVTAYRTQLPDKKILQQKLHELFENEKYEK